MGADDKSSENNLVIAQEGYTGGVYSPEGYKPILIKKGNKSTAGHQPLKADPNEVISVKTQPKNPPKGG